MEWQGHKLKETNFNTLKVFTYFRKNESFFSDQVKAFH